MINVNTLVLTRLGIQSGQKRALFHFMEQVCAFIVENQRHHLLETGVLCPHLLCHFPSAPQ